MTIRSIPGVLGAALAACTVTACALRLGGPKPEQYDTVVLAAPANADAADVAARVRGVNADIVLLSAQQDSAWFASVAAAADLDLSGPGRTSGRGLAFLTDLEILGDTALALTVPGGGHVHMHDALYKIDKYRNLDLMMVRFDAADIRAAVNALLQYISTDVGADAAIMLAFDGPTALLADSATVLMRAFLSNARECRTPAQPSSAVSVRLLFGPSARVSCISARTLDGSPPAITARLQVER